MFQATRAVSRPSGPWLCAGRPACYRLTRQAPDGRVGAVRPTGQLHGLAQEKQSWYKAGHTTKYSTRRAAEQRTEHCFIVDRYGKPTKCGTDGSLRVQPDEDEQNDESHTGNLEWYVKFTKD